MKFNSKFRSVLILSLLSCSLMTGCKATNQIDIIDDQGNIIDKPIGYDKLPSGLEDLKTETEEPKKSKLENQNIDELRDKNTGYVTIDKANELIKSLMNGYTETDRVFDFDAGVTRIFYIKNDEPGKEFEVRILHPYDEDGITPIENQVLQIFIGDREVLNIDNLDENAQH